MVNNQQLPPKSENEIKTSAIYSCSGGNNPYNKARKRNERQKGWEGVNRTSADDNMQKVQNYL